MEKKDSTAAENMTREVPDPEVSEKTVRGKFTGAYEPRIIKEVELCAQAGEHT